MPLAGPGRRPPARRRGGHRSGRVARELRRERGGAGARCASGCGGSCARRRPRASCLGGGLGRPPHPLRRAAGRPRSPTRRTARPSSTPPTSRPPCARWPRPSRPTPSRTRSSTWSAAPPPTCWTCPRPASCASHDDRMEAVAGLDRRGPPRAPVGGIGDLREHPGRAARLRGGAVVRLTPDERARRGCGPPRRGRGPDHARRPRRGGPSPSRASPPRSRRRWRRAWRASPTWSASPSPAPRCAGARWTTPRP